MTNNQVIVVIALIIPSPCKMSFGGLHQVDTRHLRRPEDEGSYSDQIVDGYCHRMSSDDGGEIPKLFQISSSISFTVMNRSEMSFETPTHVI